MKNAIYAMYQDINQINKNVDQINYFGGTGAMSEDHWSRVRYTDSQMDWLKEITTTGGKDNGGK